MPVGVPVPLVAADANNEHDPCAHPDDGRQVDAPVPPFDARLAYRRRRCFCCCCCCCCYPSRGRRVVPAAMVTIVVAMDIPTPALAGAPGPVNNNPSNTEHIKTWQ